MFHPRALEAPDTKAKLNNAGGLEPFFLAGPEFAALIRRDYDKYGKVVKEVGVKLIGPGRIQDNVVPISQLRATTPEKIVAAIHARDASLSLKDVQFMLLDLDAGTGKFQWSVNIGTPGSGALYLADLNGGHVAKPGEAASRAASGGAVRPPI